MATIASRRPASPRSTRRRFVSGAAAIAALTMLTTAACSDSAEPTGDEPITMWFGLESTDPESVQQFEDLYATPFRELHPDITLDFIPIADEGSQAKLQTALAAGTAPDFIDTPGSANAIPYADAGYLLSLDSLSEREDWADLIFPWAFDMGVIDGELLAIPTGYETLVLYYNTTLFEEHGWQPPTDRQSLEVLAKQMQEQGIVPFANAGGEYQGVGEWILSALYNQVAGPRKINQALNGEIPWSDPAFVEAAALAHSYMQAGYFGGSIEQYFTLQFPQLYAMFASGEAGMMISGSWEMGSFANYFGVDGNEADWAWVPLPPLSSSVPSGVYPLSVGGTLSINAASKNPAAAEEYLAWYMSDVDNMWKAIESFGANPLPIRWDAAAVPEGIDPRYVDQYRALSEASEKGMVGYVTWTSWGGGAETYLLENMDRLFSGDLSPEDFQKGMDEAFQEDLASGIVPPVFDTAAG